jgi:4-amino-4-deoxy-L-arabinose transferase-like glycosyltransferase
MRKHLFSVLLVLGLGLIFLSQGISRIPLTDRDETRYSIMAKTVLDTGDWVVTWLNHQPHLDKPPLFVWMAALSMKVFGINELGARMAPLLMALGTLLLVYLAGSWLWNQRAGVLSALILMAFPEFYALSRYVVTDMALTFFSTGLIVSFLGGLKFKKPGYYLAGYLFAGLAILTKGPVGIALPGFILLVYLWKTRQLSRWKEMRLGWGILITLLISAPWYLMAERRLPGYLYFFFVKENLMRFFTKIHKRGEPFFFFIPIVFFGIFPWSLFLWQSIKSEAKDGKWTGWIKDDNKFLCVTWFLTGFLFFSLSKSKLPTYILPYLIPLALLLGAWWDQVWKEDKISLKVFSSILSLIGIAILVIAHIEPLRSKLFKAFLMSGCPLCPLGFIFLAIGLIPFFILKIKDNRWAFGSILILLALCFTYLSYEGILVNYSESHSTRDLCQIIKKDLRPGDVILVHSENRWSASFYLPSNAKVMYINDWAPLVFTAMASPRAYVLLSEKDHLPVFLEQVGGNLKVLGEEGRQVLVLKQ